MTDTLTINGVTLEQGAHQDDREVWLVDRAREAGGSDVYEIVTNPFAAWVKHSGLGGEEEREDTFAMRFGRKSEVLHEEELALWMTENSPDWMGQIATCGQILRDPAKPWLHVTPDLTVMTPGQVDLPVSLKARADLRPYEREEIPRYDWMQLQAEMYVLNAPYGVLSAMSTRAIIPLVVERDDEWIEGVMVPALKDHHERVEAARSCIENDYDPWNHAPEQVDADDLAAIKKMQPGAAKGEEVDEPLELDPDLGEAIERLNEAKAGVKFHELAAKRCEAQIRRAMEDGTHATCAGYEINLRKRAVKEHVRKASTSSVLYVKEAK